MKRIACVVAGLLFAICTTGVAAETDPEALSKQVDEYNQLIRKKRFDEAEAVSRAIQASFPDHPVAELFRARTVERMLHPEGGPRALRRNQELVSRVYSVADVISSHSEMSEDGFSTAPVNEADFEPLIELIQKTVAPRSWDTVNGPGSMRPFSKTGSLVIRQTQGLHDQIADLLSQLRRLRGTSITVEVEFLTLTRNCVVWHNFGLGNPNTATLTEAQRVELVDSIPDKFPKSDALLSVPKVTVANGEAGSIESPASRYFETLKLRIEPLAGADSRLQLRISNEDAPDSAVIVNLKSDESAIVDVSLLSKMQPKTVADIALRGLFTPLDRRTVLIITPTVKPQPQPVPHYGLRL